MEQNNRPATSRHANWEGHGRVEYALSAMRRYLPSVDDAHATLEDPDVPTAALFFVVYDCHGGPVVSQYCVNHFHVEDLNYTGFASNLPNTLTRAFFRMDELLREKAAQLESTRYSGEAYYKQSEWVSFHEGSTACVALIREKHIIEYYVSAMQGYRSTMEDAHATLADLGVFTATSFFAVYDGHGGPAVAQNCAMLFYVDVLNHPEFSSNLPSAMRKAFFRLFSRMDALLRERVTSLGLTRYIGKDYYEHAGKASFLDFFYVKLHNHGPIDEGSTMCVALIACSQIIAGNAGGSHVLSKNGQGISLSTDHKPNILNELQRIQCTGYSLGYSRGAYHINDGITVSRLIGDMRFKKKKNLPPEQQQSLACSPEIYSESITADTELLVITCYEIWDVLQNEEVVDYVGPHTKDITKDEMKDEDMCLTDVIVVAANGAKQLADRSNKPAKLGILASHPRKTVNPPLGVLSMCQIWAFLLVILVLPSSAFSSTHGDEVAEIGSCHFDKTSLAALSCVQPAGGWNPPSISCCNALIYAIDTLPGSNERGACCLCRYIKNRWSSPELVTSYVLCQGKDSYIAAKWSTYPITTCSKVCPRRGDSSGGTGIPTEKDPPVVPIHRSGKILWIVAMVVAFCCMICFFWYFWWFKPAARVHVSQSPPRTVQMQVHQAEDSRSSARRSPRKFKGRRLSSSRAPNV